MDRVKVTYEFAVVLEGETESRRVYVYAMGIEAARVDLHRKVKEIYHGTGYRIESWNGV